MDEVILCTVAVHLVDGTTVQGQPEEGTKAQIENLKKLMGEMLKSSDGWQVNVELSTGWAIFPKQSVLYVELLHG